ncbi:hypothetical protein N9U65_00960 [Planctomycetaceae bacterium]|nr:hypothetical protein [Planctomycetaceae bacterium]
MTILLKVVVLAAVLLSGCSITPSRSSLAINKTIDIDKEPLDGTQIEFRMDWIR